MPQIAHKQAPVLALRLRSRMRRSGLVATITALAFGAAAPAFAVTPVSEPFTASDSEAIKCKGFKAILERQFTGTQTTYFDKQGNPVRWVVQADMTGSVTNSKTSEQVSLRGQVHFVADLVKGTETFDGQVFMANDRGEGSVIQDTGRFVLDAEGNVVFEAGPHEAPATGGQVFCDAVA